MVTKLELCSLYIVSFLNILTMDNNLRDWGFLRPCGILCLIWFLSWALRSSAVQCWFSQILFSLINTLRDPHSCNSMSRGPLHVSFIVRFLCFSFFCLFISHNTHILTLHSLSNRVSFLTHVPLSLPSFFFILQAIFLFHSF